MNDSAKQASVRIGIKLPKTVYEAGKHAAQHERRSFSNYILTLIEQGTKGGTPRPGGETPGEPQAKAA